MYALVLSTLSHAYVFLRYPDDGFIAAMTIGWCFDKTRTNHSPQRFSTGYVYVEALSGSHRHTYQPRLCLSTKA